MKLIDLVTTSRTGLGDLEIQFVMWTSHRQLKAYQGQMQLARVVGKNEKVLSWKFRNEVGKNEFGNFGSKLESTAEYGM